MSITKKQFGQICDKLIELRRSGVELKVRGKRIYSVYPAEIIVEWLPATESQRGGYVSYNYMSFVTLEEVFAAISMEFRLGHFQKFKDQISL